MTKKHDMYELNHIRPTIISNDFVRHISDVLLSDISVFQNVLHDVDYLKIDWDDHRMKQVFGDTIEKWEYAHLQAHVTEQLYVRSLLKYYNQIYNIYLGNGTKIPFFLTKFYADRIFNLFKKKYYDNYMEIIYNKYKNENVNYFSNSLYKEALEVISSTFINDKLNIFAEMHISEIIDDWLHLNIKGEYYDISSNKMIKVKTCKDLFLLTCTNHDDKDKAYQNLHDFTNSALDYMKHDTINPLAALIVKVFFIAVFNAMLDRMSYEYSDTSFKIRSMEKNFYTTQGCAVRDHAQKSLLTFIEDAKNYKYSHDHVVFGSHYESTNDDYSLFDCFIAPIMGENDQNIRVIQLEDRYKPNQAEHRIAKLMAPYQVIFSKISTMESQLLFALNSIYNTKNLTSVVDGRKEPLLINLELKTSNNFYKNMCFVKDNIEEYQELINNITKEYAVLYDHVSWSFTKEINELLNNFFNENIKVVENPTAMINIYNGLKTLIGSFEEYLYLSIRNPIKHIYEQFSTYPYTMDLTDPMTYNSEYVSKVQTMLLTFESYLEGSDKKQFMDFLHSSAKIFDGDDSWSCYDTIFAPIIKILSENGKDIIKKLDKINSGFAKFEKVVCKWYMVMMNRSKYITGFDIDEYKKSINNSRISILQDRVQELFK